MIKEVIFDIDNTLYNYETGHREGTVRLCRYVQEAFGAEPEEFMERLKRSNQELTERLGRNNAAIHSRSLRLQNLLEVWGKPLFPHVQRMYDLYWNTLLEKSGPEPGAAACMEKLQELGISIGIGTDMTAAMQYKKLERFGFAPFITHMVTSQEAGVEKPHPDFMALCVRKAGVKAEECAFVGDHFYKDACGSRDFGMHGIWYNPEGKEPPEGAERPTQRFGEIRCFDELVPYIQSIH